ncbi:uncharacterized protein M6B38_386020 [Iris pallida]|uniref:Uncharacterized protein n=1 Tax=Iris pallida TaxID=29817 RepID=A0AAX6G368_IRIPA|nr:uncharacterized protein M6B38_386020 [Iris pallida]
MDAFSMKLWWKLRHGKGLWVELLKSKYFRKRHPCDAIMTSKCSHIWRRILWGRKLAEPFISFRLGRGEGSARCEAWIPGDPRLDSVTFTPTDGLTSGTRRGTGRQTRRRSRTQARESADGRVLIRRLHIAWALGSFGGRLDWPKEGWFFPHVR